MSKDSGDINIPNPSDHWLAKSSQYDDVAVSSRTRFARNINGYRFAPHADRETLKTVNELVNKAITENSFFEGYIQLDLADVEKHLREYLKESRLISKEMEQGGEHRSVYLAPDASASILVNEEDHIRIQALSSGLDLPKCLEKLMEIHDELGKNLTFAESNRLGYLTACPTNVGTGFRGSVMLHLPALNLLEKIDRNINIIAHDGLTVRGFYGENSSSSGDYYQISNEITLGKSIDEILNILMNVLEGIINAEKEARIELNRDYNETTQDQIWRSYALLSHARQMDVEEAMNLLSKIRLGIDSNYFENLTHNRLNRLSMEVQNAHVEALRRKEKTTDSKNQFRAGYLRSIIQKVVDEGKNSGNGN